jgi:hypothetical protein
MSGAEEARVVARASEAGHFDEERDDWPFDDGGAAAAIARKLAALLGRPISTDELILRSIALGLGRREARTTDEVWGDGDDAFGREGWRP